MEQGLDNLFEAPRRERGVHLAFETIRDAEEAKAAALLAPAERQVLQQLRFPKRRREWFSGRVAGKAAVRRLLADENRPVPEPAQIEILSSQDGRPVVRVIGANPDTEVIGVSISHAGEIAAVAGFLRSKAGPVGLDLEPLQEIEPPIDAIAFTPRERRAMAPPADRARLVLHLWTAKEAVLKAAGLGLSVSLHEVHVEPGPVEFPWAAEMLLPNRPAARFRVHTACAGGYIVSLAFTAPGTGTWP